MVFADIKVGDTVGIEQQVKLSWGRYRSFIVQELVTKVTKTQFHTPTGRYMKTHGGGVGDNYTKAIKTAEDQSLEYEMASLKLDIAKDISMYMNIHTSKFSKFCLQQTLEYLSNWRQYFLDFKEFSEAS